MRIIITLIFCFFIFLSNGQDISDKYPNGQKKFDGTYLLGNPSGHWIYWYENGKKQAEGYYLSGKRSGIWEYYHVNGNPKEKGNFINDKQNGEWTYWHENGQKRAVGSLKDNQQDGHWVYWYDNGVKEREGDWSHLDINKRNKWIFWDKAGHLVKEEYYDKNGNLLNSISK